MYDQIRGDVVYIMLYAGVTAMTIIASLYLLLRRGNAFAPDITPPVRLRRWTAALFAVIAMSHVWYMPIMFLTSKDDIVLSFLIGGLLDSFMFFPIAVSVLLVMLQDRRRQFWPLCLPIVPIVVGMAFCVANRSMDIFPILYGYALLLCIGLIIYMVHALRQYRHWLCDNYADLEHKEVWQSFIALAAILLLFVLYAFSSEVPAYQYTMQIIEIALIYYLLWRVETLSDLTLPQPASPSAESEGGPVTEAAQGGDDELSQAIQNIEPLLQHCIDSKLYLQHDLTISQLAKALGTNRFYLSQYFSSQGITYNAYINDLRINHFITLYREAVANHRNYTARQLAEESGYRSYSTFTLAFKQRTGQNVTAWMKDNEKI